MDFTQTAGMAGPNLRQRRRAIPRLTNALEAGDSAVYAGVSGRFCIGRDRPALFSLKGGVAEFFCRDAEMTFKAVAEISLGMKTALLCHSRDWQGGG